MHYRGPRKRRQKRVDYLFEKIMAEKFPNPGMGTDTQVQESKRFPNKMNPKRCISYVIIKMTKVTAAREKPIVTYKGNP